MSEIAFSTSLDECDCDAVPAFATNKSPDETSSSLGAPVLVAPAPSPPPPSLPAPPEELLELVGQGLAPGADESTRAAARELWSRVAHLITAAPPAQPVAPAPPPMPVGPGMPQSLPPGMPLPRPPATPITAAVRALQQMPADQVLELLLARLRAQLPTGATVPTPKGIQFQLVPLPTQATAR